jgi:hypothetical protein
MNKLFSNLIAKLFISALILLPVTAYSAVNSVRSQPAQRQILANQDTKISVSWQVSVTPGTPVVNSFSAQIINPSTGATLSTINTSFSSSGTYIFNEVIELNKAQVTAWQQSGIRRVIITRSFTDQSFPSINDPKGQVVLSISSSGLRAQREATSSDLLVRRLDLSFTDNLRMKVVKADTELKANLILAYSGNGLLEGRWQLAEPGSTEGKAFYRTLTLVRQYLGNAQQTTLNSPPLPTTRAGKYRLRFCVTNSDLIPADTIAVDAACPIEALSVEAIYEVTGNEATSAETLIRATPESGDINAKSQFNWAPVDNAVIYQLQLFTAGDDNTKADEMLTQAPNFIAGMLLPVSTSTTNLSPLVLNKLEPGKTYLWRLTAHNQNGELIGKSREWRVRYTP